MDEKDIKELIGKVKVFCAGKTFDESLPMARILNEKFGIVWSENMKDWISFVKKISDEVWSDY